MFIIVIIGKMRASLEPLHFAIQLLHAFDESSLIQGVEVTYTPPASSRAASYHVSLMHVNICCHPPLTLLNNVSDGENGRERLNVGEVPHAHHPPWQRKGYDNKKKIAMNSFLESNTRTGFQFVLSVQTIT